MRTIMKFGTAIALAGVLAMAVATPSEARYGRRAAAAVGLGVGTVVGAAAIGGRGYYYGPGYYAPGYAYGLGYWPNYFAYWGPSAYAYEPSYAYAPRVYGYGPGFPRTDLGCWKVTEDWKGYGYYGSCETPTPTPTRQERRAAQ